MPRLLAKPPVVNATPAGGQHGVTSKDYGFVLKGANEKRFAAGCGFA